MGRKACLTALLLAGALAAGAARAETNLYEWISAAPLVVAARTVGENGRYIQVRVFQVLRGGTSPGGVLQVDRKLANRDRVSGEAALDLKPGRNYLLLLTPAPDSGHRRGDSFLLARGVDGVRPLPEEGSAAMLEAADRMVRLQDGDEPFLAWGAFSGMLPDPNPIVVETVLDLFLKFRQGGTDLLPRVRPLLAHDRPRIRLAASELAGRILARSATGADLDEQGVLGELVACARRDPEPQVRVAATAALSVLPGDRVEEILQEIARDDPEQAVRYVAQKGLYERRLSN